MAAPAWLTARPIAHRGLHGLEPDLEENTLGAVEAAIARGLPAEVDLRITADGGLVVFHDASLRRLTGRPETVAELDLDALRGIPYARGGETIASIDDLFALVSGRTPLLIELKSPGRRDATEAMVAAFGRSLSRYGGDVAAMSFDPDLVELLRRRMPEVPRGILSGEGLEPGAPRGGTLTDRLIRSEILHAPRTRPDFVGYAHAALPRPGVALQRRIFGLPVLAWTVRGETAAARALRHADQIIFEGYIPAAA